MSPGKWTRFQPEMEMHRSQVVAMYLCSLHIVLGRIWLSNGNPKLILNSDVKRCCVFGTGNAGILRSDSSCEVGPKCSSGVKSRHSGEKQFSRMSVSQGI